MELVFVFEGNFAAIFSGTFIDIHLTYWNVIRNIGFLFWYNLCSRTCQAFPFQQVFGHEDGARKKTEKSCSKVRFKGIYRYFAHYPTEHHRRVFDHSSDSSWRHRIEPNNGLLPRLEPARIFWYKILLDVRSYYPVFECYECFAIWNQGSRKSHAFILPCRFWPGGPVGIDLDVCVPQFLKWIGVP